MMNGLSLALTLALATAAAAETTETRPNILWFVVDDMSPQFGCYGESAITTPRVDALAAGGLRFTSAYVTAPVCSTSRSAMITGMYQTRIGAHHHRSGRGERKIHLPEGVVPVPALFHQAGYHTCIGSGLAGLDHRGLPLPARRIDTPPLGKTDYNFVWDPREVYDSHDWHHRKPDQPFFMQVQLHGGKLRDGQPRQLDEFLHRMDQHFGGRTDPAGVVLPPYYPRDPALLEDWAAYLDSVRVTDWHVGRVLDRLAAEGLLENTFIIFMTDHGISHARGKQFLYDEGTHIPFILAGPMVPQGGVRTDLVEHIDMAPTSLAVAGIPIPGWMQGRNLLDPALPPRRLAFAARDRCDETMDRIRSVRDRQFLYIHNGHPGRPMLQPNAYKDNKPTLTALRRMRSEGTLPEFSERVLFSPTRPVEELYDYRADPFQIHNLAADPAFQSTLGEIREALVGKLAIAGDPAPETEAEYDDAMAEYLARPNPRVEANIRLMKQWANEGR